MFESYLFNYVIYLFSLPEDMLIDFREKGRAGEIEGEKHRCQRETLIIRFCLCVGATGDRTCNPGMFPDWELNWQPSGLWDAASTN